MKYRFIPAFVMLLAGLVCCILSVVQRWPVMYSLFVLVIVLIIFYIIITYIYIVLFTGTR